MKPLYQSPELLRLNLTAGELVCTSVTTEVVDDLYDIFGEEVEEDGD